MLNNVSCEPEVENRAIPDSVRGMPRTESGIARFSTSGSDQTTLGGASPYHFFEDQRQTLRRVGRGTGDYDPANNIAMFTPLRSHDSSSLS